MLDLFNHPLVLVFGFVALVEGVVIALLRQQVARLRRTPFTAPGDADQSQLTAGGSPFASLQDQALTGSLDRFSVTEVIQFLNTIRETGILDIVDHRDNAVHRVMVNQGEIVDAFNGDERGETAINHILQCGKGAFTFIRGDLPTMEQTVNTPTMTILMENFKTIDENFALEENAVLFER